MENNEKRLLTFHVNQVLDIVLYWKNKKALAAVDYYSIWNNNIESLIQEMCCGKILHLRVISEIVCVNKY